MKASTSATGAISQSPRTGSEHDLIGGAFAVLESDPGVFTTLIERLGVRGLEVEEVLSVDSWALDVLSPRGLIFCFLWHNDQRRREEFADPDAADVWFAHQLSDDACATQAILNVLLNCDDVDLGEELMSFREESREFTGVIKGLAISNSRHIREAHNSVARPIDVEGSIHAQVSTFSFKQPSATTKSNKKRKTFSSKSRRSGDKADEEESFHFLGYVPSGGKVWELDGLSAGPLEVGEILDTQTWLDVVRPVLRTKMQKFGGDSEGDIRFNLLALVDSKYERCSDALEALKRERIALERQLDQLKPGGDWKSLCDPGLLALSRSVFSTSVAGPEKGPTYSKSFGSQVMDRQVKIFRMTETELLSAWHTCIQEAKSAKASLEMEISRAKTVAAENAKRTHNYTPFIQEYIRCLSNEGMLEDLLKQSKS
ncbi:cysteine proteinase [Sistotremastrum niveocremeum HHB9708]|nr:cysteine proteinase [Sistotremastrum niveocremeum HHB9708]